MWRLLKSGRARAADERREQAPRQAEAVEQPSQPVEPQEEAGVPRAHESC